MQAILPVRLFSASFQLLVEAVEGPISSSPCSATHMHKPYGLSSYSITSAAFVMNQELHRHAHRSHSMSNIIVAEVFDAHHLVLLFARWTLARKSGLPTLTLSHTFVPVLSCAFLSVLRSDSSSR